MVIIYYFYCPNCKKEEVAKILPNRTVANCRDGFGIPINHFECPDCHNLDAGYMLLRFNDENEKLYYQSVISMYQNIRGIKTK